MNSRPWYYISVCWDMAEMETEPHGALKVKVIRARLCVMLYMWWRMSDSIQGKELRHPSLWGKKRSQSPRWWPDFGDEDQGSGNSLLSFSANCLWPSLKYTIYFLLSALSLPGDLPLLPALLLQWSSQKWGCIPFYRRGDQGSSQVLCSKSHSQEVRGCRVQSFYTLDALVILQMFP